MQAFYTGAILISNQNVEVVRRLNVPYEGVDAVPFMREGVERLGPDFQPDAVLASWAEDPAFQHLHPDIEWDARATGLSATARGPRAFALWWADWVEAWESYVYRVLEYRDLGDWVLVCAEVQARGRGGIAVEMRTFQLYEVRDGKVAVYRVFLSEQEALEAAGRLE
jgi:ketosteroid isomerase-like protein